MSKESILDAAVHLSRKDRYDRITRGQVARLAGCATGSINYHFASMTGLRTAIMERALKTDLVDILGQGLMDRHPVAMQASDIAKERARASIF